MIKAQEQLEKVAYKLQAIEERLTKIASKIKGSSKLDKIQSDINEEASTLQVSSSNLIYLIGELNEEEGEE